jgi:hypothetical protein
MNFRVKAKGQVTQLTIEQVTQLLIEQALKSKGKSATVGPHMAETLTTLLEDQNVLRTLSPRELATICIDVGYHLNTFLRKNDVEIEEQQDATQSPIDVGVNPTAG